VGTGLAKGDALGFQNLPDYRRGFAYRTAAIASAIPASRDDPRTLLIEELELTVDVSTSRLKEVVPHPLFARLIALKVKSDLPILFSGARMLAKASTRGSNDSHWRGSESATSV